MPLTQYSDPMVFALAVAGAPHLYRLRHPGHFNILVAWMRAKTGDGRCPTWDDLHARVHASYRDFLAVADFQPATPRWRQVGWNAGNLLASRFDMETSVRLDTPLGAAVYRTGDRVEPAYDEIPGDDGPLGLLGLPVTHPGSDRPLSALGVFALPNPTAGEDTGLFSPFFGNSMRFDH